MADPGRVAASPQRTAENDAPATQLVDRHPLSYPASLPSTPSDRAEMSIPLTPQTRRAGLLTSSSSTATPHTSAGKSASPSPRRSPHGAASPVSVPTPSRLRQLRYVRDRTSSAVSPTIAGTSAAMSPPIPPARPPSPPQPYNVPTHDDIHALVSQCNEAMAGHAQRIHDIHQQVLEAIAAKERYCLDLRETLRREEEQLQELRTAWQRMALRVGTGMHAQHRSQPDRVPTSVSSQVTVRPVLPSQIRPPSTAQPTTKETRTTADPFTASSASTVPSSAQSTSPPLPPLPQAPQARAQPELMNDLGADVIREKISSGWHVLSKRFLETTASLTDMSSWKPDEAPLTTSQSSRASIPPFSDDVLPTWKYKTSAAASSTSRPSSMTRGSMSSTSKSHDAHATSNVKLSLPPVKPL